MATTSAIAVPSKPGPRYVAKCKGCAKHTSAIALMRNQVNFAPGSPVYIHERTGSVVLNCKGCGAPKYATRVAGVFNAAVKCGARCMSATGTTCECSCAGKNHGGNHG